MKRTLLVLAMAAILVLGIALPATASGGNGESFCSNSGAPAADAPPGEPGNPGQIVSYIAQNVGHSGDNNPGNAQNPFPPFIAFVIGCNPNA